MGTAGAGSEQVVHSGEHAWYILAEHAWCILGEHQWYILGEHRWYIYVRLLTRIPAGGEITYFWSDGEEGNGIVIEPYPPLEGIDEVVRAIGFDPEDLEYVQYHLAHVFVDEGVGIEKGAFVITGQDIGRPVDQVSRFDHWTNRFSYVIRLGVDRMEYQINPCWLPHDHNQPDWCYVCYPGAPDCFPDQFTPQPSP